MNKKFSDWTFLVISWISGGYLIYLFHYKRGFPPIIYPFDWDWIFLGLGILLLLFPFAKRIKIGKFVEFEREVRNIKDNISEFKTETRQSLSLISSTVNTISNVQEVKIYTVPGVEKIKEADEEVEGLLSPEISSKAQNMKQELILGEEDNIMALARTRIILEQLLRKILGKKLKTKRAGEKEIKFLSAGQLFRLFLKEYPDYKPLEKAFVYVIKICNAAIHGQKIPEDEASAAFEMSSKIIAALKELTGE